MEGRVFGEWSELLERECAAAAHEFGPVDLDLAEVSYVDAGGVLTLQRLGRARVTISNCPPLIRELLNRGDAS